MFTSSGSGKKPHAQEMVQVDRSDSASPFWRAPQRETPPPPKKNRDSGLVVGAAYSHADMLKIDSLNISNSGSGSNSRPRTPPSSTSNTHHNHHHHHHARNSATSPPRPPSQLPQSSKPSNAGASSSSPPFKTYMNFLSNTNDDWNADEGEDIYGYEDDDGDDFGLPSLSNMKRRSRRIAAAAQEQEDKLTGEGGVGYGDLSSNSNRNSSRRKDALQNLSPIGGGVGTGSGFGNTTSATTSTASTGTSARRYSNSADIAIERPVSSYPMPKKSEGKILRPQYKDILRDPANALHLISHPTPAPNATAKEVEAISARISRINKFKKMLQASTIPLADLRALAWSGVPGEVRAMTWQLLLSYLPTSSERRVATLERKRKEYLDGVRQAFDRGGQQQEGGGGGSGGGGGNNNNNNNNNSNSNNSNSGRGLDEAIWHQISIDVPRTNPHLELYGYETTQRSLERILYVWAVRHPASGYVQGINDLVTPFWQVFLGMYIADPDVERGMDPGQLPRPVLDAVEADAFWCLTKLLDGIQDHYIVAQPGIQRQVAALRDLTARIDAGLARHLEAENVEFIQFSFRWMNCLLMREISVKNTIRMWDTYMAEEQGFSEFHLYVCAAFLVKWSDKLVKMDFQEIMMFLQSLPTREWTEKDIELLLSEAYIWQSLFKGSSAHLRGHAPRSPSMNLQL